MLLKEVFNAGPRLYPDKIAVVDGSRRFTYRDLGDRWNRLSNALLDLGLKKGDCLCVLLKNSIEVIDANAAAVKTGALIATINYRLDARAIETILNDTKCPVLIIGNEFLDMISRMRPRLSFLKACISVGCESDGMLEYESLLKNYSSREPVVHTFEDDPAVVNFTSGTTGVPKGAVASRTAVLFRLCHASMELFMNPYDRYLVALPLVHIGANMPALAMIFRCATIIVHRDWDAREFCRLVQNEKVTKAILTPGLLNFLLNFSDVGDYDLGSLQRIQYGGAPMAVGWMIKLMKLMPECKFQQGYGTSESFTQVLLNSHIHDEAVTGSSDAQDKLSSIGIEAALCRARVVNEKGDDVSPGEIGEIILGGPMIMTGYLNKPKETAEKLKDGWFYTGDLARVDDDGYIYLIDRKNRMIITGGENVYPAQVEAVLSNHPKIAEIAVLGVPDDTWGEAVKAVVVVKKGETLGQDEVIDFCKDKMATYAKPKSVDFVDRLPYLTTGKTDFIALKNKYCKKND
jgi:long-chain acyl-CoA synthetase